MIFCYDISSLLVQYLSLDINWNMYKPEQREEFLRDLEDLVKTGYSSLTSDQQKDGRTSR
jgi:hypothetical protein